jgi:uncharacterized membrane protein YphA (DoxX/SURF4 family)
MVLSAATRIADRAPPLRPTALACPPARRRSPLNKHNFQVGLATVVLLVAIRLGLGCHFLYEGLWKIKHAGEFSAEPFLTQAKGPLAPLFYAMIDDIDGRGRLADALQVETEKGKRVVKCPALDARWDSLRQKFVDYYRPGAAADEATERNYAELTKQAQGICNKYCSEARQYLTDDEKDIDAYLAALDRFQQDPERSQGAPFQKKRRWDRMQELRREAAGWIKELEGREADYVSDLSSLLDPQRRGQAPGNWNPLAWSRTEQINFAVTYGLTAIGVCLLLGLCTRLAALGGAAFMCFVVLSQWAFPGTYPPDPPMIGHALLINKDFIEMLALLLLATTSVGRWGGLDYFVCRCCRRCRAEG